MAEKLIGKRDSNHILSNLFLKRDNDLNWDVSLIYLCEMLWEKQNILLYFSSPMSPAQPLPQIVNICNAFYALMFRCESLHR